MVQNRIHLETISEIHIAGFVAIFIEANYLTGAYSKAGFYSGACRAMLQRLAV